MTTILLTDRLLREALSPAATGLTSADLGAVVSERTHRTRQVGRRALPWRLSPAASAAEGKRVRLIRLALVGALLALTAGVAAVGARLFIKQQAPPQALLLQNGVVDSVPLTGGERRPITALSGRTIVDFSISLDGSMLATLRDPGVLEIWDAAAVLNGTAEMPILLPAMNGVQVMDTGVWRPDGSGVLISGSDHGGRRIFLVDVATGATTQVSPPNVSVDDWQPSFDGRWLEVVGQSGGHFGLYVVDLANRSSRQLLATEGDRIPTDGALGWSPDSTTMTVHMEIAKRDAGIWRIALDGTGLRQVTPPGQPASWMNWSPDGQWIAYQTDGAKPACVRNRTAVWVVHPDGTDAHSIAEGGLAAYWADDSRHVLVEWQGPLPGAPLGGMVNVSLDGMPDGLVYAYTDADVNGPMASDCHRYGVLTKFYRALARGIR